MAKVRALIVEDSAFMRRILKEILERDGRVEVVGVARHGEQALVELKDLRPDVITLDVEMPKMDGLTALKAIMAANPTPVVMISSMTSEGARVRAVRLSFFAVD